MIERESINVLKECIELQDRKSRDYQNPTSSINQADYYPSGCLTIHEIMHAKMLRIRSVMEAMQNDPTYQGWLKPGGGNLSERLGAMGDAGQIVEQLYLSVLCRRPDAEERHRAVAHEDARRDDDPRAARRSDQQGIDQGGRSGQRIDHVTDDALFGESDLRLFHGQRT